MSQRAKLITRLTNNKGRGGFTTRLIGLELTAHWVSRSVCRCWCFQAHS